MPPFSTDDAVVLVGAVVAAAAPSSSSSSTSALVVNHELTSLLNIDVDRDRDLDLNLEIESNDFLATPPAMCSSSNRHSSSSSSSRMISRRRNSMTSDGPPTVSLEHFPIPPIPERAVAFHPYGELFEIETLEEYSDEEIAACWYDDEEIAAMRRDVQDTVRRVTRGPRRADDYTRGLEPQLQSFHSSSRRLRENSITAVLTEQHQQRQLGVSEPLRIAEAYVAIASRCLGRAVENARFDAWEAYRIHQEPLVFGSKNKNKRNDGRETAKANNENCFEQSFRSSSRNNNENEDKNDNTCWLFNIASWFPRAMQSPVVDMV